MDAKNKIQITNNIPVNIIFIRKCPRIIKF